MASNPPFQVEDQTDEDFFDKLVDDDEDVDFKVSTLSAAPPGPAFADGNESDEVKAFANLSIGEFNGNGDNANDDDTRPDDLGGGEKGFQANSEAGGVVDGEVKEAGTVPVNVEERSGLVAAGDSLVPESVSGSNNGNIGNESSPDCTIIGKSSGSVGSGIKEVDWSAFNADSAPNDRNGFGSYSDFFSVMEEDAVASVENVKGNLNVESEVVYGNEVFESGYTGNSNKHAQHSESYSYCAATETSVAAQDVNSSEYWENMYPGWKYDTATGLWYQLDGYDANANIQGDVETVETNSAADWSVSDGKSEVSYLQQTAQPAIGSIAQSGKTEYVTNWNNVSQANETTAAISDWNEATKGTSDHAAVASDWNQAPQVNNGYPSHMVFDPQYPGWYYDTIGQEWRSLDSYTASDQPTVQVQDQLNQNGSASTQPYIHNDNHTMFGTKADVDNSTQPYIHNDNHTMFGTNAEVNNHNSSKVFSSQFGTNAEVDNYNSSEGFSSQGQGYNWGGSLNSHSQQASSLWQHGNFATIQSPSEYRENQQVENHHGQTLSGTNFSMQKTNDYGGAVSYYDKREKGQSDFSTMPRSQSFASNHQFNQPMPDQIEPKQFSNEYYGNQNSNSFSQQHFQTGHQYSYAPTPGRSSAGRPPHALVTFGFGGKLIVMKDNASYGNLNFGSQQSTGSTISVLNLAEVVAEKADASSLQPGVSDYFHALCRQSFPGPLSGGSAGSKELNKWIDERLASLESAQMDFKKVEALKLLLSLLKIACKHYGKVRSPFGADTVSKENDLPESAVAKLFAAAKGNSVQYSQYGATAHCLQNVPSEGQILATAIEVQGLLVSGRKQEALFRAQEGQLWGPALVLAAQLGDQFYVDTVKQMALRQLVAGSPLRTLCLLIAGQPADVFSADTTAIGSMPGVMGNPQQSGQMGINGMLDEWEENLAVITANRTKDDELVLIHLGDCLLKERSDNIAAHICYLVAEANFEPYSDSARLCLVGADHWKFPRTYATPEAIQRTEIFEYSKVLGNSQFILFPFQPYKLVYAHMLAEVGRTSDALKYCQAVLRSLKTGRSPEVETLRQLASSLEERIKTHQQGGFSTNLASTKLVGKLLNLFDSTAHRVVGGLPPPVPSTSGGSMHGHEHSHQPMARVSTSQSTMAMSSLMPSSASMEPISGWSSDENRKPLHNRSVSEPDFGRSPREDDSSKEISSTNGVGKTASRFGRFGFGSQLLQKTVGLVLRPRQEKQAKLGESNKFYYDEKLKRWVEEGAEPPPEEKALAPPPTAAVFQNGTSDYNLKTALKSEAPLSNGTPEFKSPAPVEHSAGMPPLPPTSNQFSARGRTGVRSRYVDTFNQGGGNPTSLFQSPSVPAVKPASAPNPTFFVPAPVTPMEQPVDTSPDSGVGTPTDLSSSLSTTSDPTQLPASSASVTLQRFPSMDNIASKGTTAGDSDSFPSHSRRASWSGSFNGAFSPPEGTMVKPLGEVLGMSPASFMPNSTLMHSSVNGGSIGDELHEVEL